MNTSITELDLGFNGLGSEAGKALAKSLEVVFTFSVNISLYDNQLEFPFFVVFYGRRTQP
jgi:hypothetical protein